MAAAASNGTPPKPAEPPEPPAEPPGSTGPAPPGTAERHQRRGGAPVAPVTPGTVGTGGSPGVPIPPTVENGAAALASGTDAAGSPPPVSAWSLAGRPGTPALGNGADSPCSGGVSSPGGASCNPATPGTSGDSGSGDPGAPQPLNPAARALGGVRHRPARRQHRSAATGSVTDRPGTPPAGAPVGSSPVGRARCNPGARRGDLARCQAAPGTGRPRHVGGGRRHVHPGGLLDPAGSRRPDAGCGHRRRSGTDPAGRQRPGQGREELPRQPVQRGLVRQPTRQLRGVRHAGRSTSPAQR